MRRTAAVLLAVTCLAPAACSGVGGDAPRPALTWTDLPSPAPAQQVSACADALAESPHDGAPECAGLSPADYLKALQDVAKREEDALRSAGASVPPALP
ncbi:hypothetical protein [Streptomyces mexicanus]|jgi:hypothetical protein|uniref:hypothetical protein n=1 Tax=Streptomyces mexicanus TaxID=178566 RepID=UPI0031EB99D1